MICSKQKIRLSEGEESDSMAPGTQGNRIKRACLCGAQPEGRGGSKMRPVGQHQPGLGRRRPDVVHEDHCCQPRVEQLILRERFPRAANKNQLTHRECACVGGESR